MGKILLALLGLVVFLGCQGEKNDGSTVQSEIKLGAIASLTGPAGEQGKNWLLGAELAVSELKAEGIGVRLVIEDDATVPAKVATAFQKLAVIDRVFGIVGGTWDFLAQTAYPMAEKHRLPFVTPTNPVEILSPDAQKNPWVFTNGLSLASTEKAIEEFIKQTQTKTLALVYPSLPFGTRHAELFDRLAKKLSLQIIYRNEFPMDGAYLDSLKLAALKSAEAKPDLAFILLDYHGLDLVTRELQRIGSDLRILTTQHLDAAFEFSKDPSRYKNTFGIYPMVADQSFKTRFMKKFDTPPRVYAAEGYDAVQFLVRAKMAGIDFGSPVSEFEYQGVVGKYRLSPDTRAIVQTPAVIMTTQHGKFEPFKGY